MLKTYLRRLGSLARESGGFGVILHGGHEYVLGLARR